MSHAHTVLHLQQCRQERLEVKVSHRVEVRLLADVGAIEDRLEALPGVVLTESRPIYLVAQTWSAIDEAEVAAVEIFEKAVAPELLKHGFVIPKCNEVGNDRLVRDDELAGVHRALNRPLDALLEIGNEVAADFNVSVAHGERVTGKELPNSLEESLALQAELEAQVVLERLGVRLDLRQKRNERLDLAGEIEDSIHLGVIKRLDPESIAGTEERLLRLVPDGKGKHSPEVLDAIGAPPLVCTQRHLCVGCGPKPGITQFRAEFDVVVNLTVVRDPVTRLVPHRLVSGGKVDDRQTAVRKADRAPAMRPRGMPSRSPVGLDLVHELQPLREARYRPPRQVDHPGYATHDSGHPSQSRFHSAESRDDPLRRMAVPVQGRTRGFLRWQLQCCSSDPLGVGAARAIPSKFKRLCPFRLVTQRQAWDAEV